MRLLLLAKPAMMPARCRSQRASRRPRRRRATWSARRSPQAGTARASHSPALGASMRGRPSTAPAACKAATGSARSSACAPFCLDSLLAVGGQHQRRVQVARRRQAERALQQDLARRVVGQVLAAHDVGDALRGVVDHHRQLVGPQAVGAPQHEVADRAAPRPDAAGPGAGRASRTRASAPASTRKAPGARRLAVQARRGRCRGTTRSSSAAAADAQRGQCGIDLAARAAAGIGPRRRRRRRSSAAA